MTTGYGVVTYKREKKDLRNTVSGNSQRKLQKKQKNSRINPPNRENLKKKTKTCSGVKKRTRDR